MKTLLSWSTGKDSAWSLHVLRQMPGIEVAGLFTTVNAAFDRVAMHAVRRKLLEAQAAAAGLPLHVIEIPWPCPNEAYEARLGAFVAAQKENGTAAMAFGDLFLEDIRAYREAKLSGSGIAPVFPLWGRDTSALAREMIAGGLKARSFADQMARFPDRVIEQAVWGMLPGGPLGKKMIRHLKEGSYERNIWQEHICHLVNDEFLAILARAREEIKPDGYLPMMAQLSEILERERENCSLLLRRYLDVHVPAMKAWVRILS